MKDGSSMYNGWLVIDKPLGMSSAKVVAIIKRLTKSKTGHGGTLDPLASGVLPIALGEATKLTQFLIDSSKEYDFEVTWGEERSTDDAEGEALQTSDTKCTREDIERILPQFTGAIQQIPPQYSAIKVEGKRAYKTARQGGETQLKARDVNITELMLEKAESNKASFHMGCSKGTYVRSLARDMGRVIGCFGYVSALRRTRHGQFDISKAITLEKLEELCKTGALAEVLLPLQEVLDGIPALPLSEDEERKIRHGIALEINNLERHVESELVALMYGNTLVAIASPQNGRLQPKRVFN